MAKLILMDEFHLTLLAPSHLREAEYNAIHRSLNSKRLHERIGRKVAPGYEGHALFRRQSPRLLRRAGVCAARFAQRRGQANHQDD